MSKRSRTSRRRLVGGAVLSAAALPGFLPRTAVAQEATPLEGTLDASPEASPGALAGETRVGFTVGDTEIVVLIADNPTSRDFVTMLPLELQFEEFAGAEKISYLPRELVTEGSTGHAPANGDLIYYVPWGNLGFFYNADEGGSPSDSVILIGNVETGFERLAELETGPVQAEIIP